MKTQLNETGQVCGHINLLWELRRARLFFYVPASASIFTGKFYFWVFFRIFFHFVVKMLEPFHLFIVSFPYRQ